MQIYAGIDEAGYGPMLGPLTVGCAVMGWTAEATLTPASQGQPLREAAAWDGWTHLKKIVCRKPRDKQGRVAVDDSKKLFHPGQGLPGLAPLERSVLAFTQAATTQPMPGQLSDLQHWLDALGERAHHTRELTPWYAAGDEQPWQTLPVATDRAELNIAARQLQRGLTESGVTVFEPAVRVVFEDQFNRMVEATRSRAAVSFTFVAAHLSNLWHRHGEHHPQVAVDRQSGRSHYRTLLADCFPDAAISVQQEDDQCSQYHLHSTRGQPRQMTVSFTVQADAIHLPVALASMIAKYAREMLMMRFNAWFTQRCPQIAPTAGYGRDGLRFIAQMQPHLPALGVDPRYFRRVQASSYATGE